MPIPLNLTPGTAEDVPTRPTTITVLEADLELAPTGTGYASTCDTTQYHALWWKVTTSVSQRALAVGIGPSVGFGFLNPRVSIWTGVPPTMTQFELTAGGEPNSFCDELAGQYFQIPVQPSTTYYIQVTDANNNTPLGEDLVLTVDDGANASVPASSILINDDADGRPAAVLSGSSGAFLRFVDYPAGEHADTVPTGEICCVNGEAGTEVAVLSGQLVEIGTEDVSPRLIRGIKSDKDATFYVMHENAGLSDEIQVFTIDTAGVVGGTTWTLPADSIGANHFAVNRAGTILYYGSTINNAPIHAYDLTNDLPLSDLTASVGEKLWGGGDGFVGVDGTIYFGYTANSGTGATPKVRRFNTNGTVNTTYTIASGDLVFMNHFAPDPDDTHFWVWGGLAEPQDDPAQIQRVAISGGSHSPNLTAPLSTDTGGPNDDPFVISNSCPLLILVSALSLTPTITGLTPPQCATATAGTVTITGVNFPAMPTVTATGPGGAVSVSVVSSTSTEIVVSGLFSTCGQYCFEVNGSDELCIASYQTFSTRRVRTFAIPVSEDNNWLFMRNLEFLMQMGVGNTTVAGTDPQVMIQVSRDYGKTWGPERWASAGMIGQYTNRVFFRNLGRFRSGGYVRVIVSDPVQWAFLAALADITEGTS